MVSTAAWACIEFLRQLYRIRFTDTKAESQQPLGLALSFYTIIWVSNVTGRAWVSTAAWACIEFLPCYVPQGMETMKDSLNSRLGLH